MSHLAPSHSSWCLLCQQRRHGHCTGTCQCPTCHPADGGPQVSERTALLWKLPLRHDGRGCYIYDAAGAMVAQMRGWGHLTGVGGLRLSDDEAIAVQTIRAQAIVDAVNALCPQELGR